IGYEGCKIEDYINKLIKNNVKIVVDVRKNAFSMKHNFKKNILSNSLDKMNIKYIHIPELGIESQDRKNLKSMQDYKELFNYYEKKSLSKKNKELKILYNLIKKNSRIALTCFEKDYNMCHRSIIAKHKIFNDFDIKHI
ncbi:MAG: DUF488 domain-containing protein, partial [Elusimicrobiota bacterium]|nr:DUF488 domain-containing protein [Elusimicrobiota bacterium]